MYLTQLIDSISFVNHCLAVMGVYTLVGLSEPTEQSAFRHHQVCRVQPYDLKKNMTLVCRLMRSLPDDVYFAWYVLRGCTWAL